MAFQAQTDKMRTIKPTKEETTRCDNSMRSSGVISLGMSWPWQSGQEEPHPIPESVFVTSAPPSKINSIPIVVATANHFNVFRRIILSFKCYARFVQIY